MQRRHFQALAQALKESKPDKKSELKVWEEVRRKTILACRLFNGSFNERKFMDHTEGR